MPDITSKGLAPTSRVTIQIVLITALVIGLAWQPLVARAQQSIHSESVTFVFDIPAGSLDRALNRFAQRSGLTLAIDGSLTVGKTIAGMRGEFTPIEGLQRLLVGSGLTYRFIDDNTVTLTRIPDRQANDPLMLQSITVTGEKLGRDVMQTMSSVNIQTAEVIERSSDQTIRDVFQRAPNISGSKNMIFSIRGISSSGSGFASTPLASVFIDGAQTSFNQIINDVGNLFDVEQVEILRGPQSTSQGGASLAGAVYLETKDPTFDWETIVRAGLAEFDTYELAIAHGGPITESLAYRVVLDYDTSDGVIENPVRGADNDDFIDNKLGRVKLLYQPSDSKFDVLLTYTYFEGGNGFNNEPWERPSDGDQENRNPFKNEVDIDQHMASLEINYDLSDRLRLTSMTSYNDYDSIFIENRVIGTAPTGPDDLVTGTILDDIYTQELRLNYDSESWQGLAGVYYNYKNRGRDQFGSDNHVTTFNFSSDQLYESYSIFAEADIDLTEHWTLTLGGCYEQVDSTYTDNVADVKDEYNDSAFVGKAGIRYTFNPDHVLGFTFSQGYRPGSVSFAGPTFPDLSPYDPEFLDNYELSYRGRFMGGKAALNANLFYFDWTDLQTTVFRQVPVFVFDTVNAGKASSYGGELELTLFPTDQLELFAGIGVTNGEYDEFLSGLGDFAGNELADAPPLNISVGFYQDWGKFAVGANADYTAAYFTDAANSEDQKADSRTIVNMTASYRPIQDVVVTAYVNNLLDKRYQDGFGFSRALIPGGPAVQPVFPQGDPRQIGVKAEVRF